MANNKTIKDVSVNLKTTVRMQGLTLDRLGSLESTSKRIATAQQSSVDALEKQLSVLQKIENSVNNTKSSWDKISSHASNFKNGFNQVSGMLQAPRSYAEQLTRTTVDLTGSDKFTSKQKQIVENKVNALVETMTVKYGAKREDTISALNGLISSGEYSVLDKNNNIDMKNITDDLEAVSKAHLAQGTNIDALALLQGAVKQNKIQDNNGTKEINSEKLQRAFAVATTIGNLNPEAVAGNFSAQLSQGRSYGKNDENLVYNKFAQNVIAYKFVSKENSGHVVTDWTQNIHSSDVNEKAKKIGILEGSGSNSLNEYFAKNSHQSEDHSIMALIGQYTKNNATYKQLKNDVDNEKDTKAKSKKQKELDDWSKTFQSNLAGQMFTNKEQPAAQYLLALINGALQVHTDFKSKIEDKYNMINENANYVSSHEHLNSQRTKELSNTIESDAYNKATPALQKFNEVASDFMIQCKDAASNLLLLTVIMTQVANIGLMKKGFDKFDSWKDGESNSSKKGKSSRIKKVGSSSKKVFSKVGSAVGKIFKNVFTKSGALFAKVLKSSFQMFGGLLNKVMKIFSATILSTGTRFFKLAGTAGALATAYEGGNWIGTKIRDGYMTTEIGQKFDHNMGKFLVYTLAKLGNKEAQATVDFENKNGSQKFEYVKQPDQEKPPTENLDTLGTNTNDLSDINLTNVSSDDYIQKVVDQTNAITQGNGEIVKHLQSVINAIQNISIPSIVNSPLIQNIEQQGQRTGAVTATA